jgi:hypothetical protein
MAEQAASIIRAQYNGVPPPASIVPTSTSSPTQTTTPGNGNGNSSNGALELKGNAVWVALCVMAGLLMVA